MNRHHFTCRRFFPLALPNGDPPYRRWTDEIHPRRATQQDVCPVFSAVVQPALPIRTDSHTDLALFFLSFFFAAHGALHRPSAEAPCKAPLLGTPPSSRSRVLIGRMSKPQQQGSVTEYEYGSDEQSTDKHLVRTRILVPSLSWGRGWILLPPRRVFSKGAFPTCPWPGPLLLLFLLLFFPSLLCCVICLPCVLKKKKSRDCQVSVRSLYFVTLHARS